MTTPFFTCLVLSHNKPVQMTEAIASLLAQTFTDWEAVVVDSGVLYDQGFYDQSPVLRDRRFRLVRSAETEELRRTCTIASWCFNECFRSSLVRGAYVTYLCDDDLLYPNAFQAFHDHILGNPAVQAMYASVDMTAVTSGGHKFRLRELIADEIKGRCCGGGPLDCCVDYLQLCHRADLLGCFPDDEYWPEDRAVMTHADGVFLEKIGAYVPIYPVPAKIGQNRKVPSSLNEGGERLDLLYRIQCLENANQHLQQALADFQAEHERVLASLRYRLVDKLNGAVKRVPLVHWAGRRLLLAGKRAWCWARRGARTD
jgi:glycosyltransferase involved in cell wall biosynthesis